MTRGVGGRGDGWYRGGEGKQAGMYAMMKKKKQEGHDRMCKAGGKQVV